MRPDLFRRVVYISCSIPLPGQTVLQMIGTGPHGSNEAEVGWPPTPTVDGQGRRSALMFCDDMDPDQASIFQKNFGADYWPTLTYSETRWSYDHLAAVPATYIICLKDNMLPVAWQEKFAARFRAERIVRIDTGHQPMNTRPQTLAEILRHEARY
jgi:pimeloyl-ACP methyl ester carboxylesterase